MMNFWKKFAYSLGSMGAALPENCFTTWVMYFYVDRLGFPPRLFASAMLIYTIWNCINDPMFGFWSDRTHTRWGRRIPFIVLGTLPLALAFYLIWVPPAGISTTALFWYYLAVVFAFDGFYTLVILNWTALYPEMYTSPRDRSTVNALRQVLGILGVIVGVALAPILIARFGWRGLGLIIGSATALVIFLSLLGSKEDQTAPGTPLSLLPALKNTLINRSFVTFVIFNLLFQTVTVLVQGVIPFYTQFALLLNDTEKTLVLLAVFLMAIASQLVWTKVVVRIGTRSTAIVGIIMFAVCLIPLAFARTLAQGMVCFALLGIGLGALLIVTDIMIAEICDEDYLRTHTRREGMYYGINALVMRSSVAISAGIIAFVQVRSGYVAQLTDAALQPRTAVVGFRLLMSAIPAVIILTALVFVLLYPLHGKRLEEVRRACELEQNLCRQPEVPPPAAPAGEPGNISS
jgi:GPH family glycoside/pentoside/hexuronide:cation symporter